MSDEIYNFSAFKDLSEIVEKYIKAADNVTEVLLVGAKELLNDALKLPKPMSKIRVSGYTHLVRSFAYKIKDKEIEFGWGKYYGPMVEKGTKNMDPYPHLYPLFEKNKEKYYKKMLTFAGIKTWWAGKE